MIKQLFVILSIFLGTYLIINYAFIKGIYIDTYQGVVVENSNNSKLRTRGGSLIHKASIKLENETYVLAICEGFCALGTKVKVEKYETLLGSKVNYYVKQNN